MYFFFLKKKKEGKEKQCNSAETGSGVTGKDKTAGGKVTFLVKLKDNLN